LNKSDYDDEKKQITDHDIAKFEKDTGIICIQTSAKTGLNVDEAFLQVTKKLMEKKDEEEETGGGPKKIGIRGKKTLF
jgi:Fe2+ transport system protein B